MLDSVIEEKGTKMNVGVSTQWALICFTNTDLDWLHAIYGRG